MPPVVYNPGPNSAPVMIWADLASVEALALAQLGRIANLPYIHHHVAAMPDVHLGIGATVGSVIAMRDAISPAAVGVDIGCGMAAVRTNLTAADLPDDLGPLRSAIEAAIPVGRAAHTDVPQSVIQMPLWERYSSLDTQVQNHAVRALGQLGTLGGGNHFIEVCLDTDDAVWLMLHSGSRRIGKEIAEVHIRTAKKLPHNQGLDDPDLSVFLAGTEEIKSYRRDVEWAQDYALENRRRMMNLLKEVVNKTLGCHIAGTQEVNCHHNYVATERHYGDNVLVTRKGAIRARLGDMGIIPGSMGTRSYIVRGLGNPESFHSASHGAGRRMSRTRARKEFTIEDLVAQTIDVECRKDVGVVDEIPAAYKDIDDVMARQRDLVEVTATLVAVLCVKG